VLRPGVQDRERVMRIPEPGAEPGEGDHSG
jgi:hypothetical protein